MEIKKIRDGKNLTVELAGRLDAVTALDLDKFLAKELEGVKNLTLELKDLNYIASAGLRILLKAHKRMLNQFGQMTLKNVQHNVRDVIELTGFATVFNIVNENESNSKFDFSIGGNYTESEEFKL